MSELFPPESIHAVLWNSEHRFSCMSSNITECFWANHRSY